jgi:SAM-dependent methyltransferase
VSFPELKARTAAAWSSAPWEDAEYMLAPVHDRIVAALEPTPGKRWLDIGTGAGAVALAAARAGAEVTGLDLAPGLIESARRRAAEEGLDVRFDVGDAETLPYEDASFDAVSSSMGLIFAPDHAAASAELARVTRPGGRLAFTTWRPETGFFPIVVKYRPPLPEGAGDSEDWGGEGYVEQMLGDTFELTFEPGRMHFDFESGEEGWEQSVRSVGPFKAANENLEPEQRDAFHREFVEWLEAHREGDRVHLPGDYLLVLGTRR